MEKTKNRRYYWLRMVLWLTIFSLLGILYAVTQVIFPTSELLISLSLVLCLGAWLVFVYYYLKFSKTNKSITLFEIKLKNKK